MTNSLTPLEAAVAALPASLVRTEDLALTLKVLVTLEYRCRLALGARIVAGVLSGIEELEAALIPVCAACGLDADPPHSAEELPPAASPAKEEIPMEDDLYPLEVATRLVGGRPGHMRHVAVRGWVPSVVVDGQLFIPRSGLPVLASHAATKRKCEYRRDAKRAMHSLAVGQVSNF